MTVALARWLLQRRRCQLERLTRGPFNRSLSLKLDAVIAALEALR